MKLTKEQKEIMLNDIYFIFLHYIQCGDEIKSHKNINAMKLYKKIKKLLYLR
jgi:hypothetical protein